MTDKIKPCPFCGFDDCYLSERDECIICPACGASGPIDWDRFGNTELIPFEMWNHRSPDPLVGELAVVPITSWSGVIWYGVKGMGGWLHKEWRKETYIISDQPYTFACEENARDSIVAFKALSKAGAK